jgi:hypothetical protein
MSAWLPDAGEDPTSDFIIPIPTERGKRLTEYIGYNLIKHSIKDIADDFRAYQSRAKLNGVRYNDLPDSGKDKVKRHYYTKTYGSTDQATIIARYLVSNGVSSSYEEVAETIADAIDSLLPSGEKIVGATSMYAFVRKYGGWSDNGIVDLALGIEPETIPNPESPTSENPLPIPISEEEAFLEPQEPPSGDFDPSTGSGRPPSYLRKGLPLFTTMRDRMFNASRRSGKNLYST